MVKKRQGFTLLEIMIVVAVIALLALLLLPNLLGSRQAVQDQAIDTTLQKLMAAQELFQARCGGYYKDDSTTRARCDTTAIVTSEWSRLYPQSARDPSVQLGPEAFVASNTTYCMEAYHENDSARIWSVESGTTVQGRPKQVPCAQNTTIP